jgi:gamma-glutamyltranspeptidase/glutathione hydrolase
VDELISPAYAAQRVRNIDIHKAGVSRPMPGAAASKGEDTTHFSILDSEGNRVAATLSINYPFGAGFVPPGTGVLLNDEMDDFSIKPGTPNVYGLVGNEANAIAPGKRMLSSMSPTFVESAERIAILGTPGGSRIISMLLIGTQQAVQGAPVEQWVGRARFHHQYLPDIIQYEPGALSEDTRENLLRKGHALEELQRPYGNMQAILWDRRSGVVSAASDPRGVGAAVVQVPAAAE